MGATGPAGQPGANGNTVFNGTGAPADSLGGNGDFYLDTQADVLYGPKASGTWPATGTSLIGPQGPAGPKGDTGPAGPQGPPGPAGSSNIDFGTLYMTYQTCNLINVYGPGASTITVRELSNGECLISGFPAPVIQILSRQAFSADAVTGPGPSTAMTVAFDCVFSSTCNGSEAGHYQWEAIPIS